MLPTHFFFYGTLVAGNPNPIAAEIHAALEPLGPARVAGALYAIPDPAGWFPALVVGEDAALGALYRAGPRFNAALLARMDAYEDCNPADPAGSLYRRDPIVAKLSHGAEVAAAAYWWNRTMPPGAQRIAGGDFAAWLAGSGNPVFRATRGA